MQERKEKEERIRKEAEEATERARKEEEWVSVGHFDFSFIPCAWFSSFYVLMF